MEQGKDHTTPHDSLALCLQVHPDTRGIDDGYFTQIKDFGTCAGAWGPVTSIFSPLSQKLMKIQQKKIKMEKKQFRLRNLRLFELWIFRLGPYSLKQRGRISPKCWYLSTKLHDVTSQEIIMLNQPPTPNHKDLQESGAKRS
jgi:hypothetical protein